MGHPRVPGRAPFKINGPREVGSHPAEKRASMGHALNRFRLSWVSINGFPLLSEVGTDFGIRAIKLSLRLPFEFCDDTRLAP